MSQLSQLKSQLHAVASEAARTSGEIAAFESKFTKSINQVESLIGGTATSADKQIIETLNGASKAVKAAAAALEGAARSARGYADSI